MSSSSTPSQMRAWQYNTASGGLDKHLKLNSCVPIPTPKSDEHLVKVLVMSLNPVDFKPAESTLFSRLAISKPAVPGVDFAGRIITPASGSDLKPGQLVLGAASKKPFAAGALAEYAAVPTSHVTSIPNSVSPVQAASIPVAGLTAWQTIIPHVKPGSRIFLNGGSGGVGTFGIQIAKHAGAHVTTSCSTPNVELCKSLGADEVLDYKKGSVLQSLKEGEPFDHVVDNVGADYDLYWHSHEYTVPGAKYVWVAGSLNLGFVSFMLKVRLLPSFLGGAKRQMVGIFAEVKQDQMIEMAARVADGRMKVVVDEVFPFEKGVDAVRKIKTGRARGKVVVDVAGEGKSA